MSRCMPVSLLVNHAHTRRSPGGRFSSHDFVDRAAGSRIGRRLRMEEGAGRGRVPGPQVAAARHVSMRSILNRSAVRLALLVMPMFHFLAQPRLDLLASLHGSGVDLAAAMALDAKGNISGDYQGLRPSRQHLY